VKSSRRVVQAARFLISVDGVRTHRKAIVAGKHYSARIGYVHISEAEARRFVFSNIRVRETDENWDANILERLATIRVDFQQVQNRKELPRPTPYFKDVLPAENPLDEKSKKVGHHGARLGIVYKATRSLTSTRAETVPGAPAPAVTFRYAPIGYLQDHNYIPCREPQSARGSEPARDPPKPWVGNSNLQASGSGRGRVKDEPINTGIGVRDDVKQLDLSNNTRKRNSQAAVIALSDDSDDLNAGDQAADRIKPGRAQAGGSKKFKLESDRKSVWSENVIVLSD